MSTTIPPIMIIINAILLLTVFIISIIMLRAASKHIWYVGDTDKRTQLKWIILKSIVAIVAIGLIAAILNVLPI